MTQTQQVYEHLHGPGLGEDVGVDVHHQVASRCVLHDEADVLRRLEARKQVDQEGMPHAVDRLEDPLLAHQAAKERTPLREPRRILARAENHRFTANILTCPLRPGPRCLPSSGP